MNPAKLSISSVLASGLVIMMAMAHVDCASVSPPGEVGTSSAASGLRSQRRLTYRLAGPVMVAASGPAGAVPEIDKALRIDVRRDMRELGLEVDGAPGLGHDLTVHLSASVQGVGRLARARAALWLMTDGQLLEQIRSDEVIESPDRLSDALARDLVERLAQSPRTAEYANTLYGRRLRPLRDSVGRHSFGRGDETAGMPPIEMLNLGSETRRANRRTTEGRTELAPPATAPEAARASAQAEMQKGHGLLAAGQARDAYAAFEGAYLLNGSPEPLFGMAESLLAAGAKQQAVIFYRAYLRRAEPNSPEAAKANAQVTALEPTAPRPQ
jgi:hypothetical protein